MKKAPAKMKKKSMAKAKMPMTTVNGKKVPAFAADGKGANDMKSGAKMKKAPMKVTASQKKKLNPGLLAAIKKDGVMMMKKAAMKMKKVSAMKMKMKKK